MSYSPQLRTSVALTAAVFTAAALPMVGAGPADAAAAGNCGPATVQYRSADADADWTSQDGFHRWDGAPSILEVRLAPGQAIAGDCEYPVSLAVYTTEGADWNTSGLQTFIEKATVYLTAADLAGEDDAKRSWQTLTVTPPDCYGQIDLYGDDITYDGKDEEGHGPAPSQPEGIVTPYNLIAAWNGGDEPCTPDEPDSPTPEPPTPTPPVDEEPPAGEVPPPPPTEPEPTPPTSAEVPPVTPSPSPSPSPSPEPVSDNSTALAQTGTPVGLMAVVAALVAALGAGLVYAAKRTRRRQA